jgi:AcrR family transcriptional regulator
MNIARLGVVPSDVNPRPYRSATRATGAAETRRRIVAAAGALFAELGYVGTTVAQVAARADVAVDTVYTSVGRKPQLVLAVVDDILGGDAGPVPAEQREYVVALRAAPDARAKLTTYASAMGRIAPQLAPVVAALVRAGEDDPECRAAAVGLAERRAANMRLLAADLRLTGELRPDLDDAAVADVIWSTNAMEYYQLVQSRGWSPDRYAAHLADLWTRMLLAQ